MSSQQTKHTGGRHLLRKLRVEQKPAARRVSQIHHERFIVVGRRCCHHAEEQRPQRALAHRTRTQFFGRALCSSRHQVSAPWT